MTQGYLHLIKGIRHKHTIFYTFQSDEQEQELVRELYHEVDGAPEAYIIKCDADNQYVTTIL